jgi:hypothetical protein
VVVALSAANTVRARRLSADMAADPAWQARVYVAKAARVLNDATVLARLARDENLHVALAAMTTPDDAIRALRSDHSGLVRAGGEQL